MSGPGIRSLGFSAGKPETKPLLVCRPGYHQKTCADAVFAMHSVMERMLDAIVQILRPKIGGGHWSRPPLPLDPFVR